MFFFSLILFSVFYPIESWIYLNDKMMKDVDQRLLLLVEMFFEKNLEWADVFSHRIHLYKVVVA